MKLVVNCKDDIQLTKMVNFKAVILFIRIFLYVLYQILDLPTFAMLISFAVMLCWF